MVKPVRGGLGRGLGALGLGGDNQSNIPASNIAEVPITSIIENEYQPRVNFDEAELAALADSIREHGIIQPLVVKQDIDPSGNDSGVIIYELIAGERRLRAAKMAGLTRVPVVIKDVTPQQMLELALIENIQRADLNPLEEAYAYRRLMEEFSLTQERTAERVGRSRESVANSVRLLNLPDEAKTALRDGKITEGHARALLRLKQPKEQSFVLQQIYDSGLNVRQTEEIVRRQVEPPNEEARPTSETKKNRFTNTAAQTANLEALFREALACKVQLFRSQNGGRLVIHFNNDVELSQLYFRITGSKVDEE